MSLSIPPLVPPAITSPFSLGTPPSQKAGVRPISFVMVDKSVAGGYTSSVSLTIRPEELTRTDVSRMTVQQTLGGAWADDFGPGLSTINIAGHTGWRGAGGSDGMALFSMLKNQVFDDWHARRNQARRAGKDPSQVQLTFADALDSNTDIVAPMNFVLRRSKSRPLLMQFQISMISLQIPFVDTAASAASMLNDLGLTSLASAVTEISNAIGQVKNFINQNIIAPVTAFMHTAVSVFNAVMTASNAIVGQVLGIATSIAQTGLNLFHTLGAVASLPSILVGQIMGVAGAFSNVFCVLKNAIKTASVYQDFTALYGASNCSSTVGGSPISSYVKNGTNPFYDVVGTASKPPVTVSPQAQTSLQIVNNTDPVLSPLSSAALSGHLINISNGVKVSA